jgi:hypothetical protein
LTPPSIFVTFYWHFIALESRPLHHQRIYRWGKGTLFFGGLLASIKLGHGFEASFTDHKITVSKKCKRMLVICQFETQFAGACTLQASPSAALFFQKKA